METYPAGCCTLHVDLQLSPVPVVADTSLAWVPSRACEYARVAMAFEGGPKKLSPLAGKPADESILVDAPRLVTAYYTQVPAPTLAAQRVLFSTSGIAGSAVEKAVNETHTQAIAQAICWYREQQQSVCGTDLHILKGDVPTVTNGRVLGHDRSHLSRRRGRRFRNHEGLRQLRERRQGPCAKGGAQETASGQTLRENP